MHLQQQSLAVHEVAMRLSNASNDTSFDNAELDILRQLARLEFYKNLGRKAPTRLVSLPSYVRGVQRHYQLTSRNAARRILAVVEGFPNWTALVRASQSEQCSAAS